MLTGSFATTSYCTGFRFGHGEARAVVRPGTLLEMWRALECCVAHGVAVLMQAANTGLTGGSTPRPDCDRDVVIVSTRRLDRISPIRNGQQVVCFAGATLHALERTLAPLGREPHSVLGSSCIGASVVGGICNNSGGALVERGPAYTELSIYARITAKGQLELVNELGIDLGRDPAEILHRLDAGQYVENDIGADNVPASDREYRRRVRDCAARDPARYNGDPRRLYGASGCAGKVAVFAVRVDTFPEPQRQQTFFLSSNAPDELGRLRGRILAEIDSLPTSAEYIHRDALQLALNYGKDTVWSIARLGTRQLPTLYRWRRIAELLGTRCLRLPETFVERTLQYIAQWLSPRLSPPVMNAIHGHEHHLIIKARDSGIAELHTLLSRTHNSTHFIRCTEHDARYISLFRFAAASAAMRYAACHRQQVSGVVSLDIALPRNMTTWFETLPEELERLVSMPLYYGHFLCHVMHHDYVIRPGEDITEVKAALLRFQQLRGAKYPAEHNFGQAYAADPSTALFYRHLDPSNSFNPGTGRMSPKRNYA